jgi:HD-like signal output (HDOD) protein
MTTSIYFDPRNAEQILSSAIESTGRANSIDLLHQVKQIDKLPPLSNHALEILAVYRNPLGDADDLAAIVERDPSLAAQVLRWANSAQFGYRGSISCIKDAITRVLGYDLVINLALSLGVIKPFPIEKNGPIGLGSFWTNALFSATLCQQLALTIGSDAKPGIAYVAGLLHNLGLLVFGHLLPDEHRTLNQLLTANPELSLSRLSEYAIGVQPNTLGLWLIREWELPEPLIATMAHHFDPTYRGSDWVYPNLVFIAECLLNRRGLSQFHANQVPSSLFKDLGLEVNQLAPIMANVFGKQEEILDFAQQLTNH